ncbi:MAG TPA: hypothetical protein PKI16_00300 [Candidatus Dojkabacteria bacterium]|nr:hypothetical protein [Candidatus Dojkabacteria bacterium]
MLKLIFRLAYTIILFIEALIMTRIVLILINANTGNPFAGWVKNTSEMFISPFVGITANNLQIDNFVLPLTPIIALVFYIIAAFILSELLKSFSRE